MKAGTEFFNKTCPICDHVFHTEDDVIVCPECARPHHEKCWRKNHGCGLIDCQGGKVHDRSGRKAKKEEGEEADEITVNCPVCEAIVEKAAVHCPYCKTRLKRKALFTIVKPLLILLIIGVAAGGIWLIIENAARFFPSRPDRERWDMPEKPDDISLSPQQYAAILWENQNYRELKQFLESENILDSDPEVFYPYLIGVYLHEGNVQVLKDHLDTLQESLSPPSFDFFSGLIYAAAEEQFNALRAFRRSNVTFQYNPPSLSDIIEYLPPEVNFEYSKDHVFLQSSDEALFLELQENFKNWEWNQQDGLIYGESVVQD